MLSFETTGEWKYRDAGALKRVWSGREVGDSGKATKSRKEIKWKHLKIKKAGKAAALRGAKRGSPGAGRTRWGVIAEMNKQNQPAPRAHWINK